MLQASLERNDKKARLLIGIFSVIVFCVVAFLPKFSVSVDLGFNPHIFAKINAIINSIVFFVLIIAFIAVKQKKYLLHKRLMIIALVLSVLFLVSYIAHNLFAGETHYGGTGAIRIIYFVLLATHIILAAIILPIILFTAYRGLTGEWAKHKKIARITFPLWLYISVTGPIIYWMIAPYYH